jgi:hypothetical protein
VTAALFAVLLAAQPEARCGECRELAQATLAAAATYKLPPLLLGAVALVESGGRNVVRQRPWGHAVGAFQLAVRGRCDETAQQTPCDVVRPLAVNAMAAAALIARRGWRRYNAGSKAWARTVRALWRRLEVQRCPTT